MVSPDRDNRKTHPEHSPAFSRRSFLIGSGTTVAALMLPCLGFFGGKYAYALDPDAAADGESNSGNDATTKIIILSNSEIGLSVYDVNEQGKTTPVIGAKVVVTPANQDAQKLEATTDDLGAVVFDIRDIGTPLDYGDDGIRYRMEASVTVTNGDDYRICTLPRIRVDSGSAMALPCCKITDPSIPYFEYLSFNGWDIQYCDCDVLRSGEARNKIPLSGKLHMAGLQSVEISFWARSTEGEKKLDDKARFTTRIEMKNGVGAFKQNELFLRLAPPDNATLPLNRSFELHLKTADKTYVFPVKLTVHDSPIAYQTGNEGIVPGVTYGQTGSSRTIFKLPSSFPPVLRSSSFTCWVPTLPIEFWVSPFGYFYFGAGLSPSKEGNSIEAFKKESFAYETFQTSDQQCSDLKNMWTNKWNTYKSMTKGTSPGSTSKFNHKFASKIGLSFAIQAIITAQCNLFEKEEDMRFNGLLAVVGDVYAFANFVQQFTIGPVPFFIALNLSFDARISLYATAESPAGDPLNISFVPSKTGLGIVFTFEIALSLGVGLSGVLAASLRGSGQISTYIGLISCEEEIEETKAYSDEAVDAALGVSGVEGVHQLADPVNAGVLLPGKTGQYRTTFTIPKSWHGTKNVYVALSDFSYETVVSAAPDGTDPIPLEHEIPHEELPRTEFSVHDENEAFDAGLSAPSIGILADDHDTIEPAENTQSGTNTTTGKNTQKGLADTGDPSSLTLAGLAVGAAAAAFAAYSARRSSLENSKDEEMN